MIENFHTYKYEYHDGDVEYVQLPCENDFGDRIRLEKMQRADRITNITTGLVLKDRYGITPRQEKPEPHIHEILDDELFQI